MNHTESHRLTFLVSVAVGLAEIALGCSDDNHGPTIGAPTVPVVIINDGGSGPTSSGGTAGALSAGGTPGVGGLVGIGGLDTVGGAFVGVGGDLFGVPGAGAGFGTAGASTPFGVAGTFATSGGSF